jgi:hypothetical protein
VSTRSAPPSALEQLVLDAVPRAQEHCGMALEPRTVAEEEKKPELEEMNLEGTLYLCRLNRSPFYRNQLILRNQAEEPLIFQRMLKHEFTS